MMKENSTTSWMWRSDDEVYGLFIDLESGILKWYDEIGCACEDEDMSIEQTAVSFQNSGIPAGIRFVPDDILLEIEQTLSKVEG